MAAGNAHWASVIEEIPWLLEGRGSAVVGNLVEPGAAALPAPLADRFPTLAELLAEAWTSRLTIGPEPFVLLSWEGERGVSTWLSPLPTPSPPTNLLAAHRELLRAFGGIVERSNEKADDPEVGWLLNTDESLTVAEASHDASFLEDYAWAFEERPGRIPIDTAAYYSISREANGNTTLCHRDTGDVVLFAHDHAFKDVTPLDGCPEFTLYRRDRGATFVDWVETAAAQWWADLGW